MVITLEPHRSRSTVRGACHTALRSEEVHSAQSQTFKNTTRIFLYSGVQGGMIQLRKRLFLFPLRQIRLVKWGGRS
jgi:hypothetical protein